MLTTTVRITNDTNRVRQRVGQASIATLKAAGAYIRGIARKSIKRSNDSSPAGHQPYTRKGALRNAIIFAEERDRHDVVIGPSANKMGGIGATHEWGGTEPPKKPPVARRNNWRLRIGGHGPIRWVEGPGLAAFAKIRTQAQLDKALEIAPQVLRQQGFAQYGREVRFLQGGASKIRHYQARPFMRPALQIARERLPKLWANSVRAR